MLFTATLFSEEYHNISGELFKYFSGKNIFTEAQYLQNSQSDQFPYNIILPFHDDKDVNPLLYFVFSQTFSLNNPDIVSIFSEYGNVVLAANMESGLPDAMKKETLSGLRTFLESAPSDAVIIIFSDSAELDADSMELIPGGTGRIASKNVIQPLIHAAQEANFSTSVQSVLLSFYRLNCVDGSEAAGLCLENGFQSAEIIFSDRSPSTQLAHFASCLLKEIDPHAPNDGTQYSIINTGGQVVIISETLYTAILFFILTVIILGSCLFSFMFGKSKAENRGIFLKWWYVGPLLILITFFLTQFAGKLTVSLFSAYTIHPGYALFLKLSFITVFFLLLCEIRYFVPLAQTDYLYAFFMMLASALDVFMYTSIDMPLLLPFSLLYIIFLSSRPIKKWWLNLCILIAVLFPLVFVFIRAAPYLRNDVFVSFTEAPHIFSLFTAVLMLPYLLMIIHIFVCAGIWDKNKGKKRIIVETSILGTVLVILIVLATFSYRDEAKKAGLQNELSAPFMTSSNKLHVDADARQENGMISFSMTFTDDTEVLRYDVSVHSESTVPMYSANLPFSFSETAGTASFNLDEYPCNPFVITGMLPDTLPVEFTISAWQNDRGTLLYELHSVVFEEEITGKNRQIRTIIK